MIIEAQNQFRQSELVSFKRMADEMHRFARTLSQMSVPATSEDETNSPPVFVDENSPRLPTSQQLRNLLRMRRMRDNHFRAELFADPAWDMLLDLLAAHQDCEEVSISSLCIASAVPPTTALRWISTLTEEGLLARRCDPLDGRRVFIGLTAQAVSMLGRYFAAISRFESHPI